jgi:hypothetical protein
MRYGNSISGRVDAEASNAGRDGFWTFDMVEERLVEAMRYWWRSPDPERRFGLGGRISSLWRQVLEERALIDARGADGETPEPRPLPLSRGDIARRDEASEWLTHMPERDRHLVAVALGWLASGATQVPWRRIKHELGIKFGEDGLRKRYSRAIASVAAHLNSLV